MAANDAPLPRPADVLPHRPPFLFVDEVTEIVPGRSATGRWRLTGEEAFFSGHFPSRPTLPGVLMVEALAQGGYLVVGPTEGIYAMLDPLSKLKPWLYQKPSG